MLQVTQAPPSKRTSFSIDDIVGRPRSRSPQQRSPCSTGSASPRSDVRVDDLSPKSKSGDPTSDIQGKLDLFRSRLHSEQTQKAFQPVIPGLNGIRNPLHPGELLRSGLLNPESMGFLQQNFQNFHQSSHPLVNLHGPAPPGLIHPHSTAGFHGASLPFGPQAVVPKDLLSLYHLQMHGAPHFLGHRFPDGLLLPPFRKPKRIRTAFSPSQLLQLERAFEKNHYVVGQERKELAVTLNLSETQVKVWFQNRRTKFKRVRAEETDGRPEGGESSMDLGHLDYLQEDDIDVTDSEDEEKVT